MEDRFLNLKSAPYSSRCESYARIGHKLIQVGHHILVFGGTNSHSDFAYSILKFNCEKYSFEAIPSRNSLPLEGFSLFCLNNKIYLWGGAGPSTIHNQLWVFANNQFNQVTQSGNVPQPRSFHASILFSNRFLIIFGGIGISKFFNDWHVLDCQTMSWKQVKTNIQISFNLNPSMVWAGGRGFLLVTEVFDQQEKLPVYCSKLYEFKFIDLNCPQIRIDQVHISFKNQLNHLRGTPTISFTHFLSPFIILIGGQRIIDSLSNLCSDVWFFNLQTLEWFQILNLSIQAAFGAEAAIFQNKIFLIGGVNKMGEMSTKFEVIDLNQKVVETKICQACREIYGFNHSNSLQKTLTIKYEFNEVPKAFFSAEIIKKLALTIQNPISAFGLLIDNSFNLSANSILVEVKSYINEQKLEEKYLQISDNSFGFSKEEIIEAAHSFTYKVETLTHDAKFEEELAIRKEYGFNLKMGTLRLGKVCLFITKTLDNDTFIAYFNCQTLSKKSFDICYYLISPEGEISSQISRSIIKINLEGMIENYESTSNFYTTRTYIFHIDQNELDYQTTLAGTTMKFSYAQSQIFKKLHLYLQSLYLKPYIGRTIKLESVDVKFLDYSNHLRKDELEGKLQKIELLQLNKFFNKFCLYRIHKANYHFREILVYHQNRLIFSIKPHLIDLCGFIEIPISINVDLCKTKIEKIFEEKQLIDLISKIADNNKKRMMNGDEVVKKIKVADS